MKIIKQINESLDNPNLSEDVSIDNLYQNIIDYVKDEIDYALDNIVMKVHSDLSDYDPDWASEEYNRKIDTAITRVAELVAEDLLAHAPDTIKECVEGKEILQEKNWKHQLSVGSRLRQAIEDADYDLIKELLIAAYKEIHEVDPENFDEDDLDRSVEDIEFLDTEPDDEIDVDESDIEDNFDYELNNLYDLCDALNIWIPLTESLNESKSSSLRDAIVDTCEWFNLMETPFPKDEFLADSWADLKDGIEMGMDPEGEVAEGLIQYLKGIVSGFDKLSKDLQDEVPFAEERDLYNRLVRTYNVYLSKQGYEPVEG